MNKRQENELKYELSQYETEQLRDMEEQYQIRIKIINDILSDRYWNN